LLAIHCSQPRFDRGASAHLEAFKPSTHSHDTKGRRKNLATPSHFRRISHNGLHVCKLWKSRCRILEQSALSLIPNASLRQRTGGPLHPYVPQSH
jgi:hypothetical protein